MRSFIAISLALATGCGDDLVGDPGAPSDNNHGDLSGAIDGADGTAARLLPSVCASRAWPEVTVNAKDTDLAVVPTLHGAAVLAVPKVGGALTGFVLDGRGLIVGDPLGTKIIDGNFTGLSAASTDGRLIVGLVDGANVSVNAIRDDLGAFRSLGTVTGSFVGDATIMHARGERLMATGGASGMLVNKFDSAWAPSGSDLLERSVPNSMTSAAYGDDAMVAWSTANDCHLQRYASGFQSQQPFACAGVRVATNYAGREGELVYQHEESVMISDIRVSADNEIASPNLLVARGTSPRIAFDGTRYWVSYVNIHGDVVVGFLDGKNTLVSTAIEGTRPVNGAYELVFVNGGIWVYAVDAETGFNANRLCLTAE